jgi:hypothetical protein
MMAANFKRPLIVSFSIIAGSIAIATAIVYFLTQNISAQAVKIASDRSAIAAETGVLASIASLNAQASQAAVYRRAMEKLLPNQDGLIGFGQWAGNLAAANHVAAHVSFQGKNISPSPAMAGQAGFSLTVNGPVSNIVAFINAMEAKSSGFLLAISSFDLASGNPDYQLSAQGNLFFR